MVWKSLLRLLCSAPTVPRHPETRSWPLGIYITEPLLPASQLESETVSSGRQPEVAVCTNSPTLVL